MKTNLARRVAGGVLSVIVIVVPGPEGPERPPHTDVPASSPSEGAAEQANPPASGSGTGASTQGSFRPVQLIQGKGQAGRVTDAPSLTEALTSAKPGQTIELADGTYTGKFVISTAGQEGNPITLRGSRNAVLTGGTGGTGYDLHLNGANYWQLVGFTVSGLEKGIMTDRTNHTVLSELAVGNTGAEAVHFGNLSSDNTIQHSLIHDTGKTKPQFGEGLYFGTAKSNWAKRSGGQPDRSNNNRAINNTFRAITAENVDAKEETSGGVIAGNKFDASAISGLNFADSIIDVKGVNYRIANNTTTGNSAKLKNGFETHVITKPETSGCNNSFSGNVFTGVTFNGGTQIASDPKCSAPTKAKPGKSTNSKKPGG